MPSERMGLSLLPCVIGAFLAAPVSAQTGDPEAGEALFRQCAACHQIGPDADHAVGPHLNGVMGRTAGALEDFNYSAAMVDAGAHGLVWDAGVLDTFLNRPRDTIPGTTMSFRGLRDQLERADMIAYLALFSDDAMPDAAAGFEVAPEILAIAGDAAYGEYLSSECTACHTSGANADGIPAIEGRPAADFVTAMQAYKQGARAHPVMTMMAGRLSDEEIAALAAYYENVE